MSAPDPACMQLVRGLHNLRSAHRGCVLTIGNFDGVHLGHQQLIERLKTHEARMGLPSTVLTFEPTPQDYFAAQQATPRVYNLRDKLRVLAQLGVARVILVRFSQQIAQWSPEAFVETLLVDKLGVAAVVVGDDSRFGRERRGDRGMLLEQACRHGFAVEACGSVVVDGQRCSSTLIRERLSRPDLAAVERLLGRPYTATGIVRHGLKLGRKLGVPTANLVFRRRLALRYGVYAVHARCGGQSWQGVASYGVRPTLGVTRCLLETHILGECGPLYGRELEVEFRSFLRPERHFDTLDALAAQMARDAERARAVLDARTC